MLSATTTGDQTETALCNARRRPKDSRHAVHRLHDSRLFRLTVPSPGPMRVTVGAGGEEALNLSTSYRKCSSVELPAVRPCMQCTGMSSVGSGCVVERTRSNTTACMQSHSWHPWMHPCGMSSVICGCMPQDTGM